MGSVRKMTYTGRDGKKHKTKRYYACFTGADGRQKRVPGHTDRGATLQLLARLEREAAQVREGVRTPGTADLRRPLAELLADYLRLQADRGLSDGHRRNCSAYLPEVFAGCGWSTFADVSADPLISWGAGKRASGCSPATVNGYLSAVRAFSRWASGRCGCPDPLARRVPKLNEEVDRRRSRRIPTPAELHALCEAARRCPRRRGQKSYMVGGPDRAMLYLTAAYTGLRASELASLTPDSFTWSDGLPAAVVVEAWVRGNKGKRRDELPIPRHVGLQLGPWLAARPAGEPLWPGDWAANRGQWAWLDRDLERAGISQEPEPITFHSLRAFHSTELLRAGADLKELQTLARHKDIRTTAAHYLRTDAARLKAIADRLPAPAADDGGK